jgi:hypothetical protein
MAGTVFFPKMSQLCSGVAAKRCSKNQDQDVLAGGGGYYKRVPSQLAVTSSAPSAVQQSYDCMHAACRPAVQSVIGCYTEHRPFGEPTKGSLGEATPYQNKVTKSTNCHFLLISQCR